MPRVNEKKKNRVGEGYPCGKCQDLIVAGETYYEWSFRYGGTHRQHTKHGRPKSSQLTQSKMSGVYAAIESAESELSSASSTEDIAQAIATCIEEIESVRDEYQDAIDNMISAEGAVAQECQEKIDELESFISELESFRDGIEEYETDDDLSDDENQEKDAEHLEDVRSEAEAALGELSI